MFSYFIDVQTNIRDKNPLGIKSSPVYKKGGAEASGIIGLHGWTSNDADNSQRQADGLFNQTMGECEKKTKTKKHDTSLNHAMYARYKEKTLNLSIQLLFCPD